jgi:hypothetical protein
MGFDLYNCSLKIWESVGTTTPKVGAHLEAHLGAWGFIPWHFFALPEHEMWLLGSLLAHTFVSPCFGYEPKARVATLHVIQIIMNYHAYWTIKNDHVHI